MSRAGPAPPFAVVGIGASAGGVDALRRLISSLPAHPGCALIIIQHLDPHHESRLNDILRAKSAIPVLEAWHGTTVNVDHAYVIQPGTNVALTDGILSVTARQDDRRSHYPIDHFLRSLADEEGPRAVGVILSGTGSDGTLGMCEIKSAGGVTFAQDEETAQYAGMPHSAIASGAIDLILPPEQIAARLTGLSQHPYLHEAEGTEAAGADRHDEFARLLAALRHASGVDFRQYRDSTIKRRAARRMLLRGLTSPDEYARVVEHDAAEAEALYRDVLINVTSFFREPEMFDEVQRLVLPSILERTAESSPLRLWVPGCATGQEPYSFAITLLEFLDAANAKRDIQIFATDLADQSLLDRARRGFYPESIESDVSAARLRRFFVREHHGYRIQKSVRDLCVFARQDLTVDPPFSRVDLVSCRNVMIYMSMPLQERLLPVFHFALNPQGCLVLGKAETAGRFADLFDVVSREHKIYRRRDVAPRRGLTFTADDWLAAARRPLLRAGQLPDVQREADRLTIARYAPPSVVINADFDVQQVRGRIAPFLEVPAGQPTTNLLRMVRDGLQVELQSALVEAAASRAPVAREGLRVSDGGRDVEFTLRVLPVGSAASSESSWLVLFESRDQPVWSPFVPLPSGGTAEHETAWLRQELASSRQYLQATLDAQDASVQELRAAHEEVLSSNEELQSTNEELETAKEELQSANEELTTVNEQFQARNDELDALADRLSNFIASADVPMVTVGRDLCVRHLTPAARRAFNLLPADAGRSIEHIKFAFEMEDIRSVIESVITSTQPWERELEDREGRWWMLRVRPFVTADSRIDGAILVAVDIDSIRRGRELLEERDYARAVVQTVREPFVVLDAECRVGIANDAFYELFDETPASVEGRRLWDTCRGVWSDPGLRRSLLSACEGRTALAGLEIERVLPARGVRTLVLKARGVVRDGRPGPVLLSVDDVTDARQADRLRIDAETLRLVDRRKDEFLGILAHELRNPLAPMQFALEMLRRADGAGDGTRARQVLQRQVAHMVRLIDDLLDVSRITEGKVELRREPLLLGDVVKAAVEFCLPTVDAARHTLTVSLPDEPVPVSGDTVRLTQVVVNLLNNAVKFTPPAGHIWLIVEKTGDVAGRPDVARLRVRDTGIGIAPEMRNQVFDMFTQGDRSLERTRGGLGVGLTLVRNLVALHGGSIDVWSAGLDRGSEFVVSLPLDDSGADQTHATAPPARPTQTRSLRILVADDNDDGREMLDYLLSRDGHVVEAAPDGQAAVDRAAGFDPDVAIVDIGMPKLNGYEVARRLRAGGSDGRPCLIALSGLGQADDKARALAAGFDHHFTKPVDLSALLGILAERLS